MGLLREFPRPGDQRMFIQNSDGGQAKGHLICKDCNRVIPLDDECLALREGAAVKNLGFQSSDMTLRIEAHCAHLNHRGTCEHRHPDGEGGAAQ